MSQETIDGASIGPHFGLKSLRQPTTRCATISVCTVPKSERVCFSCVLPLTDCRSVMSSGKDYILRVSERPHYLSPPVTEAKLSNLLPWRFELTSCIVNYGVFSVPIFFSTFLLDIKLLSTFRLPLHHMSHECPHGVILSARKVKVEDAVRTRVIRMIRKGRQRTNQTATRYRFGERVTLVGFERLSEFSLARMQFFGSNSPIGDQG